MNDSSDAKASKCFADSCLLSQAHRERGDHQEALYDLVKSFVLKGSMLDSGPGDREEQLIEDFSREACLEDSRLVVGRVILGFEVEYYPFFKCLSRMRLSCSGSVSVFGSIGIAYSDGCHLG